MKKHIHTLRLLSAAMLCASLAASPVLAGQSVSNKAGRSTTHAEHMANRIEHKIDRKEHKLDKGVGHSKANRIEHRISELMDKLGDIL